MKNNGLVAVKRMNKHGVLVTKHVKPDSFQPSPAASVPAPSLKQKTDDQPARDSLLYLLVDQGSKSETDGLSRVTDAMPASLVTASLDLLEANPGKRLTYATRKAIEQWGEDEDDEKFMQNLQFGGVEALYDRHAVISPLGLPMRYERLAESAISSESFKHGDYDNPLPTTPESMQNAITISYFMAASELVMRNSDEKFSSTHDIYCRDEYPELAEVFLEFPERRMELADYVIKNGRDAGRARQYMRGEPLIFADGAI